MWYRDDGHLWSHHGTDPCNGENATIFDVVRLHNFHPEKDDVSLPISERASHKSAEVYFASRFPEMGHPAASIDELDDVLDEPKVANPNRFCVVRAEQFADGPPLEWLIKGVIPKAELAVAYGHSGVGKSFVVYDMVCCIERGVHWFGAKTYPTRGVYICAEAARGFRKRMKAYAKRHKVALSSLPGVIGDAPNLMEAVDVQDLIAGIRAYGHVGWIVVDTLASVMPGANENESAAMTRLVANAKAIAEATGAIVILVHHSGKDAAKGARGHSSLRAASDLEIEVTRDGDNRIVTVTKSKDDMDGRQFGFRLAVETVGTDAEGDDITSCVIEEVKIEDITKEFEPKGDNQKLIWPVLKKSIESGVTDAETLQRRAMEVLTPRKDLKGGDRRPSVVTRAFDSFKAKGVLFTHDNDKTYSLRPVAIADEFGDE